MQMIGLKRSLASIAKVKLWKYFYSAKWPEKLQGVVCSNKVVASKNMSPNRLRRYLISSNWQFVNKRRSFLLKIRAANSNSNSNSKNSAILAELELELELEK